MPPATPTRRNGSMGPPAAPHTPSTGSTSRSMVVTPLTDRSYSSAGRGRSETPFQVKAEPMDPPSPSPMRLREPSTLPPISPDSRALVPYQPRADSSSPSMIRTMRLLRDISATPSRRHRYPSGSVAPPFRSSSPAPSSARSMSEFSSLAPSEAGSRIARRHPTAEYDRRTKQRRVREGDRDPSMSNPTPVPSLPPLPPMIIESSTSILDTIAGVYIQDVDAEESGEKDIVEFKQHCLEIVLVQLFAGGALAIDMSKELADEEVICPAETISLFISILSRGLADILKSAIEDFAVEGSKVKSKSARHTAWYAKYRSAIPGRIQLLSDLSKVDAATIISLLAQHWSANLQAFQVELSKKSASAKKSQCRTITESARRLCDLMAGDIWNEK